MPTASRLCSLLLLTLGLSPLRAEDPPRVAELGFLSGAWTGELTMRRDGQTTGPAQRYEAIYSSADGGVLLSTNKAYDASGAVEFFELELFREREGRVVLVPHPGGRAAASFALTGLDRAARRAVFESPDNDWPQRIVYERVDEGRLRIVASGAQEGAQLELRLELSRAER